MAKFELKFMDCEAENCFIYVNHVDTEKLLGGKHEQLTNKDVIHISLTEFGKNNQIWLDKSTAIKFAKTLRTEINKIQD